MSELFSVILEEIDLEKALMSVRRGINRVLDNRPHDITLKSLHIFRIDGASRYKYTYVVKKLS